MMRFKVSPDGGDSYELEATSRDVYVWEKTGRSRKMGQLGSLGEISMVALYELAHLAAKRQQLFIGSLEDFTSSVDLELLAEEAADPTNAGATPAT